MRWFHWVIVAIWAALFASAAAVGQIGPVPPAAAPAATLPVTIPPGLTITDGYLVHPQAPVQTINETGTYRVSVYFEIVFAVGGITGDNSVSIYWTDDANVSRTVTSPAVPRGGGYYQQSTVIRAIAGSTLDYSTANFNGAAGVNTWHLYIVVERLN